MFKIAFVYLSSLLTITAQTSFVLVGDSTTANGTSVNSGGWGNGFCGSAVNGTTSALEPDTPCVNTAVNGATTGTFVADGHWAKSVSAIQAEVANGRATYVTIQFGHNDQKIAPSESMGANLTLMIEEIRALHAEPVLVTSLTRRNFFENGMVNDALEPWAAETIRVAEEQGTHLLDLHAASIKYVEDIGPDAAHRLNKSPGDNTHLNNFGAIVFGRMVADLLSQSFCGQLPIIPDEALSFNISHGIPSY